jgi:excisionase family DNA binding protein
MTTSQVDPDVLTPADAARLLRVSKNLVYTLLREGKLPAIKIGQRRYRLLRSVLLEWMADQAKGNVTDA